MEKKSEKSFSTKKSNGHTGRLFETNVCDSLLNNLNVEVLSNLIVMNNKYTCSRFSILFTPDHENFCDIAIPDQKIILNFDTCDNNTQNKSPKKYITLSNQQKYSLLKIDNNHIEVTNNYKNSQKNKTFNFKIGSSQEVNNYIWLIRRQKKKYEIRIYEKTSNLFILTFFLAVVGIECALEKTEDDEDLIFRKNKFICINWEENKDYFPNDIQAAKYYYKTKTLVLIKTKEYGGEEVQIKDYIIENDNSKLIFNFLLAIDFKFIYSSPEELDGLFKANEDFDLKLLYNENYGYEKSFNFYDDEELEDSFKIKKDDLIFVEIKDGKDNLCTTALEQSYKHLKDLRSLCFQKEKINLLIILRGNFKIQNKSKTLISKINEFGKNITVMITYITEKIFFGLDVTRPRKTIENLSNEIVSLKKQMSEIIEKNVILKKEMNNRFDTLEYLLELINKK